MRYFHLERTNMTVLAIDLRMNQREWKEVEAYRYGNVTDLGRYDLDGFRNVAGDIVLWNCESDYSSQSQRDRLASGWIGTYTGKSVDDVLTVINEALDSYAF
jgi:hypothetical protein